MIFSPKCGILIAVPDLKKKAKKFAIDESYKDAKKRRKELKTRIDDFLDPKKNKDNAKIGEEDSEWSQLRKYISIHFPEIAEFEDLSANQAMVAVAHALGYSQVKISKLSGIRRKTVAHWLGLPELKYAMDQFRAKEGNKDHQDMVIENAYLGSRLIKGILSMPPALSDLDTLKIQMDLAKFAVKQGHGEAAQNINVNATSLDDVLEAAKKSKIEELSEEEEDELFLN